MAKALTSASAAALVLLMACGETARETPAAAPSTTSIDPSIQWVVDSRPALNELIAIGEDIGAASQKSNGELAAACETALNETPKIRAVATASPDEEAAELAVDYFDAFENALNLCADHQFERSLPEIHKANALLRRFTDRVEALS